MPLLTCAVKTALSYFLPLAALLIQSKLVSMDNVENTNLRTRMSDVARAAGVSLKSVSRVINSEDNVSAKLRTRVERAIRDLSYVPDPAARSLAGSRSFTIGVLFHNPSPNYTIKMQSGVYEGCRAAGYHLRIDNLNLDLEGEQYDLQLREVFQGSRVDGFVLTPPHCDDPRLLDRLEALAIPYVRICPVVDSDRSLAIEFNDREAARKVADHFCALGHRRFGLVAGPPRHGRAQHRKEGFISRIHEICPEAEILVEQGHFHFISGMEAGHRLLTAAEPPTAIFATNDDMAVGVMSMALQLGRKVPDDVSVCGFDDSWIALSVYPALTTYRQPIQEMGNAAVELLLGRREGGPRSRELTSSLVLRASTGYPKASGNRRPA